ncbi:MAG: hypothetical protein IKV87_07485, partial [Methanobrevibacter sp.]|nr:hypothetical protein [Methanobrevibacter sp.]
MIITLVKKERGIDFIKSLEKQYYSISELEKTYERTGNMKLFVDLENWKYYLEHPDEYIEISESLVNKDIMLSEFDFDILDAIKHSKPKSIRDLARIIDKDVSNVQPKVHRLAENGFISLKKGNKNSIVPYLNYD